MDTFSSGQTERWNMENYTINNHPSALHKKIINPNIQRDFVCFTTLQSFFGDFSLKLVSWVCCKIKNMELWKNLSFSIQSSWIQVNQHITRLMLYWIYARKKKCDNFFFYSGIPLIWARKCEHYNIWIEKEKVNRKIAKNNGKHFWKVFHLQIENLILEREYLVSQCDNCMKSTFVQAPFIEKRKTHFHTNDSDELLFHLLKATMKNRKKKNKWNGLTDLNVQHATCIQYEINAMIERSFYFYRT